MQFGAHALSSLIRSRHHKYIERFCAAIIIATTIANNRPSMSAPIRRIVATPIEIVLAITVLIRSALPVASDAVTIGPQIALAMVPRHKIKRI